MKRGVGVFSLIVMALTQIITPYAYAVGDEFPVEEVVTDEVVVEEPMLLEPIEDEDIIGDDTAIEQVNPMESDMDSGNNEETIADSGSNTELSEEQTEEISSGDNDVLSGEQENLEEEEIENLSGAESSSGFFESITEGVKNLLGIGETSEDEEILESKEIYGTGEYEGVKVEVYAQTGLFASGTILKIEPIVEEKLEQVKEVLSGEVEMVEDEQTVVAFDITFRDPETQEELQPKNGTVQVTFNYEDNENLKQAEENEEQEVKVYHLNDKDEEGNKIEELTGTKVEEVVINKEESKEDDRILIEANNFSPYVILLSTLNTNNVYTVSFNTNGGTPKNDVEITGGTKLFISLGLQHSYTRNISEDGTYTGNYGDSWGDSDVVNKIITIPGANKLRVTIKHGIESTSYDWVCMWAGSYPNYTAANNYSTSVIGKLGGTTSTLKTNVYYVNGDTVTFSFKSDSSVNYYGYYATVEGLLDNYGDDPTREGSKFLGRFTEDGTERNIYDDIVESDITLNASWECKYGYYTGENNQSCIELPYSQYTIEGDDSTRNTFKYRILRVAGSNGSEYFIMDKNLGALEAWDGTWNDSSHNASYGYYYQRGNNYGFSSKTISAGGYSQITVPDDKIPSNYSSSSWIYNTKWNVQDDLRGAGGTEEDRKGPCPEGWHIPEILERKAIYKARDKSENKSTDKGTVAQNFMYDLRIPPAGYRSYSMGFGNMGSRSNLWSTTTYIDQYARNFYVPGNYFVWNNAEYRSAGIPVRCVMNNPDYNVTLHVGNEIIQKKQKKNSLITIPFNSTDENHVIEGWYLDSEFTEKFDFSQVVNGDIELYANQIEFEYNTITVWNPNNPLSGFIIMDRNLGATEAGTGENAYGYFYQRGNNYGFSNTGELALFETQAEWNDSYDNSGYYETGFYTDSDYWLDDVNHVGLWGGSGDSQDNNRGLDNINETAENRKGPCPQGWHVPSAGEWSKLIEYWNLSDIADTYLYSSQKLSNIYFNNSDDRERFISELKLVDAGYRTNSETVQGQGVDNYEYRSSSPTGSSKYAYVFKKSGYFYSSNSSPYYQGRSIRCFKNEYNPILYTITFDTRGGDELEDLIISSGNSLHYKLKKIPNKEFFVFSGWYIDPDLKYVYDIDLPITGDLKLYAAWNAKIPVHFNTNGGNEFEMVYVEPGKQLELDSEPQKPGCFFEGWYFDNDFPISYDFSLPVNQELYLYAKWNCSFGTISISDPNNINSGFTIMDRNLGAKEVGTGEKSFGYYYQWGNNHGFLGNGKVVSTTGYYERDSEYDNKGYYGTQLVTQNNSKYDYWSDEAIHNGLWGGSGDVVGNNRGFDIMEETVENRKGPCPEGYHIPSAGERSKLLEYWDSTNLYQKYNYSTVSLQNYELNRIQGFSSNFSEYFQMPLGGSYQPYTNNPNYWSGDPTGYYWSSSPTNSDNYAISLNINTKYNEIYAGYVYNRTYGFPIRCFKNNYEPQKIYKAIFKTNGGELINDREIRENHKLLGLPIPKRDYSIFEGWYTNKELTDKYDYNQLISGDLNLFAKWGCKKGYTLSDDLLSCEDVSVKFRANGGSFDENETHIIYSQKNIDYTYVNKVAHTPNINDNGDKTSDYPYNLNTNEIIEITGADNLNIRIIYGGGELRYARVTMREGKNPKFNAYDFGTSVTGKLGGGNHDDSDNMKEYNISGDSVTFGFRSLNYGDRGDGFGYYAVIEGTGKVITVFYPNGAFDNIPTPTRDGYDFTGWYFDNGTFEYEFNESDVITGDSMDVYAKWNPHTYTIKFDINGGTGNVEDVNVIYGEKKELPKVTREGYYLKGWESEDGVLYKNYIPGGTGLTIEDGGIITLKAQWEMNAPSAGGGRIQQQVKEQEHNVAEEKTEENKVKQEDKTEEANTPEKTDTKTIQETTMTNTNTSSQSTPVTKEVQSAYEWAYDHDVTTMPTLEVAMPDGVVKRGHLAKMVVNYAVNVLGYTIPEKIPSECRWNDNKKDWESEEIKEYAVKSCALGLMGLDMPKFLPNLEVTRAQFGTIMSRLLWGKKYAGGTPYYRKHLNALKENNIMTQIENPERRVELRQWVWLMLMRSAEK